MMRKCFSVSRSLIDESNDSVGRGWIVFRHGILAKLTSAAEIQLLFKQRSFSSPSFYFAENYFIDPLSQELFNLSSFYLSKVIFIIQLLF